MNKAILIGFVGMAIVAIAVYASNVGALNAGAKNVTFSNGLSLIIAINATHLSQNQSIYVDLRLNNTTEHAINLSSSNAWPNVDGLDLPLSDAAEFCSGTMQRYAIKLSLFRGYYTFRNISSATGSLRLYPAFERHFILPTCPIMESYSVPIGYSFMPLGDMAVVHANRVSYGDGVNTTIYFNETINYNITAIGYMLSNGTVASFGPGTYTLVGADQWGSVAIVHFEVV